MTVSSHGPEDGAIGNPGPGGWAAVLSCGRNRWRISGAAENTTANEMELTAAIEALKSIEIGSRVTLCSDSEYLIRGIKTTIPLHKAIMADPVFIEGKATTSYMEEFLGRTTPDLFS